MVASFGKLLPLMRQQVYIRVDFNRRHSAQVNAY